MENNVLALAALLLFLAAAAEAQVHDVEVAREYSQSVGGIRLSYGNASIMDEVANLTVGRIYEVRYKIRNLGDYSEKANISVLVSNLTRTWEINHRSRTVDAKKSIYLSEKWDTGGLGEGAYWVVVHAMVSEDSNVSNDNRTRNVTLWGRSAATTTTSRTTTSSSTSRTSTSAATTTSSTSSTSTTRLEDEEDAATSTTTTSRTTSTQAAAIPSSTTSTSSTSTTSAPRTSTLAAATSSSTSSTVVNAAAGNAIGVSSEGRQTVVVFLILLAGAVLYLSRK